MELAIGLFLVHQHLNVVGSWSNLPQFESLLLPHPICLYNICTSVWLILLMPCSICEGMSAIQLRCHMPQRCVHMVGFGPSAIDNADCNLSGGWIFCSAKNFYLWQPTQEGSHKVGQLGILGPHVLYLWYY